MLIIIIITINLFRPLKTTNFTCSICHKSLDFGRQTSGRIGQWIQTVYAKLWLLSSVCLRGSHNMHWWLQHVVVVASYSGPYMTKMEPDIYLTRLQSSATFWVMTSSSVCELLLLQPVRFKVQGSPGCIFASTATLYEQVGCLLTSFEKSRQSSLTSLITKMVYNPEVKFTVYLLHSFLQTVDQTGLKCTVHTFKLLIHLNY